jgi:hypothetical protein
MLRFGPVAGSVGPAARLAAGTTVMPMATATIVARIRILRAGIDLG